jgi:transposase
VPWSEPGSGFTALLEALVIDWLKEASLATVARRLRLSWDQVDGIQARAVRRGLARRKRERITHVGVDETSYQRRHQYVTVVNDLARSRVLYVADGRKEEALDRFYAGLSEAQLEGIEAVAMDMWQPFIKATLKAVPAAESKIAFDRFHVAKCLGEAVNNVRKTEHRELRARGDDRLTRTKYLWLQNPENMSEDRHEAFENLRDTNLKVARAWAIKETARDLWGYVRRTWAEKAWKKWLGWIARCRLEPMKKAGRTIKEHLWGIINAIVLRVTNAGSESINARIQWIKRTACGFRNRERFRNAILFHCGGLDLYPSSLKTTHSIS